MPCDGALGGELLVSDGIWGLPESELYRLRDRGTASAEDAGRAVEPVLRSGQPLDERDGCGFLSGEARVQAVRE